jgi:Family of unknown function (DUF6339)
MATLCFFRQTLVDQLHDKIDDNLDKYKLPAEWVSKEYERADYAVKTGLNFPAVNLSCSNDDNKKDIENVMAFYEAFSFMTPLQARKAGLWTRLAHVDFWDYMRSRWGVESKLDSQQRDYVSTHYFVTNNSSRSLFRHGIARLWWIGYLTHESQSSDPYLLTKLLLSSLDLTQSILERSIGRSQSVLKGFLRFMQSEESSLNRGAIRHLVKYLNTFGGVSILDAFSENELIELLRKEYHRYQTSVTSI